nr:FtsW/RodA/SpoVE family cell cycle protein [Novosphingobium sp.]
MSRRIVPEAVAREPWNVLLPLLALNTFGSTVLYSAAGGHLKPWATLHMVHFFVFLVMAFVISRLPRDLFKTATYPIYGALVILLVAVDLFGSVRGGSQRWINLGFMMLQPSELMKPVIVLTLAYFFDSLPPAMTRSPRALLPAAALVVVPVLLVM